MFRPDTELQALPELPRPSVPKELEQLSSIALLIRPELQGRLAAIARDEKAVELAKKRFYPNITLGLTYMDMEKTNAVAPKTASGMPNVGLFVGFNLPVHHKKYQAGVLEAEERARADAKLYEAQRDETFSEIQDFMVQAKVQENVLTLLRDSIGPANPRDAGAGAKRLCQEQRRLRDGSLGLARGAPGAASDRSGRGRAGQGARGARASGRPPDE